MNKRIGTLVACGALVVCLAAALCGCNSSQKYEPAMKNAAITSPSIIENGVLTVGVSGENAPMSAKSSTGLVGIDVDIAAAIADELGLKLKLVDVDPDPMAALNKGTVDIVMGVDKGDATSGVWKSDAYVQSGVTLFATTKDAAVPAKGSGSKIAVQAASLSNWAISGLYEASEIVAESDLVTAFKDLGEGKASFVAADAVIGMYAAKAAGATVFPIAIIDAPTGYCVGVADSNSSLKSSITAALSTLKKDGVIDTIQKKWLVETIDVTALSAITSTEASAAAEAPAASESEE